MENIPGHIHYQMACLKKDTFSEGNKDKAISVFLFAYFVLLLVRNSVS